MCCTLRVAGLNTSCSKSQNTFLSGVKVPHLICPEMTFDSMAVNNGAAQTLGTSFYYDFF